MPFSSHSKKSSILNDRPSNSWVMLDAAKGFVPLPKERVLFTSPPRTTLALQSPNSFPGKEPLNLSSSGGTAFVTNQRLVYLPATPVPQLESFSAPILSISDTHIAAPFFGPNVWSGILKPTTGGGIPAQHAYVELKMTFKDGGAFDFHSTFERVKESLAQAQEVARETGRETNFSNVHLEQLPAYQEANEGSGAPSGDQAADNLFAPTPIRPGQVNNAAASSASRSGPPAGEPSSQDYPPPNEPPPGYEETQSRSLMDSIENSTRKS